MKHAIAALLITAIIIFIGALTARGSEPDVDVAIIFAVDVSSSMDADERQTEREAHAIAITSDDVQQAIREAGRIAVAYVEWGTEAHVLIPWRVIDGPETAGQFASDILSLPVSIEGSTNTWTALRAAEGLLGSLPWPAERAVVDVMSDGIGSWNGLSEVPARDALVQAGATVNALLLTSGHPSDPVARLKDWYGKYVVGGTAHFLMEVHSVEEFAPALRAKIVRELG